MSQAIDAVLAGTKGFAVALLAPLTARIGNRPRVAGDPRQVLGMCSGPSSLAVVEFLGEGSLPMFQGLVRDGRGLRIVAGVPAAHAGAEGTLRALGVEVGRWDGKTDGVISAVDRAVATMNGAPAAALARPAMSPARAPAAAVPRPTAVPQPVPAKAPVVGAAAPVARPAAPSTGSVARTGAAAPSPVARPAAATPVGTARPGPAGSPAFWPASPAPSVAQPYPATPQHVPAAPASPQARPPAPRSPPAPAAAAAQPTRPPANFFDDLDADVNVDVDDLTAPDSRKVDFHAPGVYVPPASAAAVDWPGSTATPAQAEDALKRAIQGSADPARPLDTLAIRTVEALSQIERAVLAGEPQPVDAAPIRKAAVMRLRVAEALATAPAPGSTVDQAALSAILGEIDALLAEVGPLLGAAPAELVPALESIRNGLVREAIDFSEAAQRASVVKEAPPQAPALSRKVAGTRLIESHAAQDIAPEPRRLGAWIALAVAVLLVGGYHARRYLNRPPRVEVPTLPGAPDGLRLVESGGRQTLVALPGRTVDPQQLEKFRAQEALKGNEVRELAPGMFALVPGKGGAP